MKIFTNLFNLVKQLWITEPARVIAVATAAIVFAASNFGIVVSQTSVTQAVAYVLTILFSGELIRSKVTPVTSPTPPANPILVQ